MLVDVEKRTVRMKIVYYGIAQSGKTTNLEAISRMEGLSLLKLDTHGEHTLVFDFATKKVRVGDLSLSFALYTVPGQSIYTDIRLTVMKGVDGIVFVVDSQRERLQENIEFYRLLKEDLRLVGKGGEMVPMVIQYNKMDLPNALSYEELERLLNRERLTSFCASAIRGEGVVETLKGIEDLLIRKIEKIMS